MFDSTEYVLVQAWNIDYDKIYEPRPANKNKELKFDSSWHNAGRAPKTLLLNLHDIKS